MFDQKLLRALLTEFLSLFISRFARPADRWRLMLAVDMSSRYRDLASRFGCLNHITTHSYLSATSGSILVARRPLYIPALIFYVQLTGFIKEDRHNLRRLSFQRSCHKLKTFIGINPLSPPGG